MSWACWREGHSGLILGRCPEPQSLSPRAALGWVVEAARIRERLEAGPVLRCGQGHWDSLASSAALRYTQRPDTQDGLHSLAPWLFASGTRARVSTKCLLLAQDRSQTDSGNQPTWAPMARQGPFSRQPGPSGLQGAQCGDRGLCDLQGYRTGRCTQAPCPSPLWSPGVARGSHVPTAAGRASAHLQVLGPVPAPLPVINGLLVLLQQQHPGSPGIDAVSLEHRQPVPASAKCANPASALGVDPGWTGCPVATSPLVKLEWHRRDPTLHPAVFRNRGHDPSRQDGDLTWSLGTCAVPGVGGRGSMQRRPLVH